MSKVQMIADAFDLQKRSRLCNIRGCDRLPTKRVALIEQDRITNNKKTIATLYLCSAHNETKIPLFLTEINKHREVGKMIVKSVQDIGLVTY
jgi:hypothetical protein